MRWRPDLSIGDSFVVCDAGGGTVDLISYTVDSLDPLRLSMCVEATGDLCGAVYLDDAFDRAMRIEVGSSTYDKLDPDVKAKVFENDWEFGPKRKYIGGTQEFTVDIPGYKPKKTKLFGKRPPSTIVLQSGHLSTMFQPVVGQIVDLVKTQVVEVEDQTSKKPKAVLLVGGFGENDFVLEQLKATFSSIPIQRPVNAWGAISRGAVIKGLSTSVEDETVTNFISKLSYGVKHSTLFNHSEHSFRDRYHCPVKKIDMAKDQFTWYLKRGQSVSKANPVQYRWLVPLQRSSEVDNVHGTIWVSELKTPPKRLDENNNSRKLCQIHCNFERTIYYDLRKQWTPDGAGEYRELDYTLDMRVAAGELEWVIYWRDQQKGRAKVEVEYE